MSEYTYEDVIINPNDPRVEIGAYYYFGDNAPSALNKANQRGIGMELVYVYSRYNFDGCSIFRLRNEGGEEFPSSFIIRKKEPSYEERQSEWIKTNDIKVGDKVRIIKEFSLEEGFCDFMKPLVGTIDEIKEITDVGIQVYTDDKADWCSWPYDCLEKVEEPKYIPFDLSKEEDRAKLRGAWVKLKGSKLEQQIVGLAINTQLVFLPDVVSVETKELLEGYEFLDGTPCGIVVEDEV